MKTNTAAGAAIVTGASRGLGLGIAQRLAGAGHPVVLVARGAEELDSAAAAIREAGSEALAVQGDVTSDNDVERVVTVTREHFGSPRVLVNNAGASPVLGTLDELTWELFERHIDVDVRGAFNATRAVASAMRAQGRGTIVNVVASAAGTIYTPLHTANSPAQAALYAFTRCTASWLAPAGVAVHSLAPKLTIRGDLGASIEELEWTVNAYNLSFAVLLMSAAALGDRFGRRRLYAAGLGLFALASAACALAPDVALAHRGAGAAR